MTVSTLAIIGAGTMGGGIVIGAMAAGIDTRVIDLNADSLTKMKARAQRYFDRLIEKGKLDRPQAEAALARLSLSDDLAAVKGADLIIEAVFEDLEVKRALFGKIAAHLTPATLIATNTSALRVSDLASALPYPNRFLGLHYFSPAEINPLVELIAGAETEAAALDAGAAFLEATGKTALRCKDSNGFAINRFFCPYTNEAVRLLDEGVATTGQIDLVARELFGLPIGPFAVMNIIKPRINLNAVGNLSPLGAFYEPAAGLVRVGEADQAWEIEEAPQPLDAEARDQIERRLRAAQFLPVLQALAEGVAAPDAIDQGAWLALRFEHPPVGAMRDLGRPIVEELLAPILARHGAVMPTEGLDLIFG